MQQTQSTTAPNADAIRVALQATGLSPEAIEAAVAVALANAERVQAQAELTAAREALAQATARAKAAGLLANEPQVQTHTKRPSRGTPKECACGCGNMTRGGTWMPGHDAKHGGYKAREAARQQ